MTTVHEVIVHCQKQIKKEPPPDKLLHYLRRLSRLKITVDDLRETGVGKTVNQLSRLEGDVGHYAGKIVEEWKAMVETQGSEDKEQSESSQSDSDHSDLEIDMNYQPQSSPPKSSEPEHHAKEEEEDEEEDEEEEDESDHEVNHQENNNRWEPSPPKKETSSYNYDRDRRREEDCSDDDDDGGDDYDGSDHKDSWDGNRSRSQHEDNKTKRPSPPALAPAPAPAPPPPPPAPIPPVIKTEPEEIDRHRDRDKHGSSKDHKNHHNPERLSEKDDKGDKHGDKRKDRHNKDKERDHRDDRQKHRQDDSRHRRHEKDRSRDHRRERDDDRHHSSRSSKHEKSRESKSHKESKEKHKTSDDKSRNKSSSESPKRKVKEEKPDKHIETSNFRDSSGGSSSSSHKRKKPDSTPSEDKNKSTKKLKLIESKIESQEIDSTSGLNFSDVLGCLDKTLTSSTSSKPKKLAGTSSPVKPPKKNGIVESVIQLQKTIKTENNSFSNKPSSSNLGDTPSKSSKAKVKVETASYAPPVLTFQPPKPTNVAYPIDLGLEDKPFRTRYEDSLLSMSDKPANDFEALSSMMSSRKDRTKVYSGNKTGFVGKLPTLFEMSIRVIQENLDCLGYTGGVPYDILKPALKCATVKQLEEIEFYNSYLQEYTDELWQYHCQRDCKGARPKEMESWKDLYYRCQDERQAKLNLLASKVKRNAELAQPVRKAKLAYVEPSSRGPKFNRSKAATIKNGMKTLKHREEKGPKTGGPSYSASAGGKAGQNNHVTIEEAAIIIPSESRAGSAGAPSVSRSSSSSQSTSSTALKKPRRAPLMQKTMKLIKSIYRR
ncbi:unnamed protein product [Allacma fusca]|uniref:TFIIS N-terminal domain-containing protein n=1 Tax=Allacma fusca TaxID=39272 RepID=A0A8J2L4M3_9HEXA|nr:unnamed protein product [Allacma fusca]